MIFEIIEWTTNIQDTCHINFSVPVFINIQTVPFASHSNVPCYGLRLPYWSTTLWYLVVTHMVPKLFTHFFKISFWLGTSGQCCWPGIMGKWTACVFWVFCHNASHIFGLVLINDTSMNLLSGSRNESRPYCILLIMSLYISHLHSLTFYIIKYVACMCVSHNTVASTIYFRWKTDRGPGTQKLPKLSES
jgi:hypothetical protein